MMGVNFFYHDSEYLSGVLANKHNTLFVNYVVVSERRINNFFSCLHYEGVKNRSKKLTT